MTTDHKSPNTHLDHNLVPADLDSYWMPFTANRTFKQDPRFIVSARGMYYQDSNSKQVMDGSAGLWCVNAGHYRPQINQAIADQLQHLDFAHSFNAGHPAAFNYASRLVKHFPDTLNHVFFTNSGSESVDTALKIALSYHKLRGNGSRQRLIGREKGYHGMGFGGISVGGLMKNRSSFGMLLPGTDHLRHTLDSTLKTYKGSWTCMALTISPPLLSSLLPVQRASYCRPLATCNACGSSVPNTAFC
jgi:beta-alanine--pyruvate transaminase